MGPDPASGRPGGCRTAEKQRAEKLLEDTCIKLSAVVADIAGVSRRDMLAVLVAGDRDQKVLAQLAWRSMHRKITVLDEAIAAQATPFAEMADHLDEIPGINPTSAYVILAEIGTDMAASHRRASGVLGPGWRRPTSVTLVRNTMPVPAERRLTQHGLTQTARPHQLPSARNLPSGEPKPTTASAVKSPQICAFVSVSPGICDVFETKPRLPWWYVSRRT